MPLSALRYEWFISHVSQSKSIVYDFAKRAIDIIGSLILGLILIMMLPFIYLALRIEGKVSYLSPKKESDNLISLSLSIKYGP